METTERLKGFPSPLGALASPSGTSWSAPGVSFHPLAESGSQGGRDTVRLRLSW